MKKILILLVIMLFPVGVKALDCPYSTCTIVFDGKNYTCDGTKTNVNNNDLNNLFKGGTCPAESLINITCGSQGNGNNGAVCTVTKVANDLSCPYGSDTLKYDNKKNKFYINGTIASYVSDSIKTQIKSGSCPDQVYIQKEDLNNSIIYRVYDSPQKRANQTNYGTNTNNNNGNSNNSGGTVQKVNIEEFNFCEKNGVKIALKIVGAMIFIAKIIVPLLIIIFGIMDFYKALVNSDEKNTKDAIHIFMRRIISGIIIFFLPTLVDILLNFVDGYSGTKSNFDECQSCLLHPVNECPTSSVGNE